MDIFRLTARDDGTYDYRYVEGGNDAWVILILREIADQIEAQVHIPDPS